MSDYDYDAAMDQLAEWEEEKAMEAYYEKDYLEYLARLDDEASKIALLEEEEDPLSGQMHDESVTDESMAPQTSPDITTVILQKIEKEAEQKISHLVDQEEPIDEKTCMNIMKHGVDEFRRQTGREMSYSEFRDTFG